MKQALTDTVLLWILLSTAGILYLIDASGMQLPLFARTTLWRLGQSPLISVGIALVTVLTTLFLAFGKGNRSRELFISGLYAGLALAFYVAFDPGIATAFLFTSAGMYRRLTGS
ncbi:hypothetical protein GCM10027343_03040 [Noviherbaspirillum agri]